MTFDPLRDVPTLELVSPPNLDYPYFEGDANFEPDAQDYSDANAWWLAECALLAYGDGQLLATRFATDTQLRRSGLTWETIEGRGDTFGFLMFNDRFVVATLRGTRVLGLQDPLAFQASLAPSFNDIVTDVRFPQAPFGGGHVHSGFADAFQAFGSNLRKRLDALAAGGRSVWFAGHSLGGALATLAAERFDPGRFQGLYTFGCPRIGDAAFASLLNVPTHFRFVHDQDLIPRLPPPVRYVHAGRLVYIDHDGVVTPDADPSTVMDLFEGQVDWSAVMAGVTGPLLDFGKILKLGFPARLTDVALPRSPVTDHAPIYYASLLKARVVGVS